MDIWVFEALYSYLQILERNRKVWTFSDFIFPQKIQVSTGVLDLPLSKKWFNFARKGCWNYWMWNYVFLWHLKQIISGLVLYHRDQVSVSKMQQTSSLGFLEVILTQVNIFLVLPLFEYQRIWVPFDKQGLVIEKVDVRYNRGLYSMESSIELLIFSSVRIREHIKWNCSDWFRTKGKIWFFSQPVVQWKTSCNICCGC